MYTNSVLHRFVLNSTFQIGQITFMHGIYAGKWSTHWIINSFLSWFIYRYVVRQACIIFVEVKKLLDYKLSSFSWRVSNPLFFTKHYRCVVLHASCPMGPPNNCHQVQSGNGPFKIRPKKKGLREASVGTFFCRGLSVGIHLCKLRAQWSFVTGL